MKSYYLFKPIQEQVTLYDNLLKKSFISEDLNTW